MRFNNLHSRKHKGVALISAMLVVALATTAAVTLSSGMQLNLRRSGNLYMRDQAWQYLLGVEQFGMTLLKQAIDHDKLDLLLGEERTLPVDGGFVSGSIVDLQAGMNVNDMFSGGRANWRNAITGKSDGQKLDSGYYPKLKKLLNDLEIEDKGVSAIIDWIDIDDDVTGNDGAEDNYYFGLEKPYRAANRQMTSLSELYLIREMDPDVVKSILNYKVDGKSQVALTAIPKKAKEDGLTKVNINSAPPIVLTALGLDSEKVVDGRPWSGKLDAKTLGLETDPKKNGGKAEEDDMKVDDFLTTSSNYYRLEAVAKIGRTQLKSYSVIYVSEEGKMHIESRSLGTL